MADLKQFTRGAAIDWIAAQYRGLFEFKETSPVVGVASSVVVAPNSERVSLTFVNFGAADVILSPGNNATTSKGVRVGASGGIVGVTLIEDSLLPALGWSGISAGAGNTLYVLEVFRTVNLDSLPGHS